MLKLLIELHGEKRICEVFSEIRQRHENILIKDFDLINNFLYVRDKHFWLIRYVEKGNHISMLSENNYIYYTPYEFLNIILPKEDLV